MIKDLFNAQGQFVGHAMFRKKNSTVDVIYTKEVMQENQRKLTFEAFDEYKADMELYFEDDLPGTQVSLEDLI